MPHFAMCSIVWCIVIVTVNVVVAASHFKVQVDYFDAELTSIKVAECSRTPADQNKTILGVYLQQGDRLLEKVTAQCNSTPCVNHTVLQLATRGSLNTQANTFQLTAAWEHTLPLDLDNDELTCTIRFMNSAPRTTSATVRSFPARKRTWTLIKGRVTPNSALVIEVKEEQKGWRSVFRPADKTPSSTHRDNPGGLTISTLFYDSTAESDDVTMVKVVDGPDFACVTILVSKLSPLSADSDQWRCRVRVGLHDRDCELPSKEDPQLSGWQIAVIVLSVLVCVLLPALGLVIYKKKTKPNPANSLRKLSSSKMLRVSVEESRPEDDKEDSL